MSTSSVFVSILSNQFLHLALNWSMVCFFINNSHSTQFSRMRHEMNFTRVCCCCRMRWRFMYSGRKIAYFQIHILFRFLLRISVSSNHWLWQHFLCVIESNRNCVTVHIPFRTRNHQHWHMQVISKFIWSSIGSVLFAEFSNFIRFRW